MAGQLPWGKLAALGLLGGGAALTASGVGAPVGLALMGAGAGVGKREWVDKPREARQMALAVETQRLSPWTGLAARMPEESSAFENALQGGVAGAQLGQSFSGTGAAAKAGGASQAAAAKGGGNPFMDASPMAPQASYYPWETQPTLMPWSSGARRGIYG